MKQKLLHYLLVYRIAIILAVLGLLLAYGLLQLQKINNPQPNDDYVKSQQTTIQTGSIQVKGSLQDEINKLVDTPVDVQPDILGRPDPFNP